MYESTADRLKLLLSPCRDPRSAADTAVYAGEGRHAHDLYALSPRKHEICPVANEARGMGRWLAR